MGGRAGRGDSPSPCFKYSMYTAGNDIMRMSDYIMCMGDVGCGQLGAVSPDALGWHHPFKELCARSVREVCMHCVCTVREVCTQCA